MAAASCFIILPVTWTCEDGMNSLLKDVSITLRRDEESGRPRINKPGSVKDRAQKSKGEYYYS